MITKPMLGRFSLYGFLKNQQYYDPFLILAFRQMGLSFFMIGVLVGFREIIVNLMEIPSGVVADLFGRRKAMIFSFISYSLCIINFLGYPSEVDGDIKKNTSRKDVILHLKGAFTVSVKQPPLRRLILESMGFEGFFKVMKDYLQPILKTAAVPLTGALLVSSHLSEPQQASLLVGPVYFVLYMLSALASRKAHILVDKHGSEDQTARFLWLISLLVLITLAPALYYGWFTVVILGFIVLYALQNIWRPVLISRFDMYSDEAMGATILSIESQAKSVSTMIIAPALGYVVDLIKAHEIGALPFWPAAGFGMIVSLLFFLTSRTPSRCHTQEC